MSVKRSITQRPVVGDIETSPKSLNSIRKLEMPALLIEILEEQKKRQQRLHNFSEEFRICYNVRDTTLRRKKEQYSIQAGLKIIRIHDFRHSHASLLAYHNINIQEISRRLGHASIEETWKTYCHLYPQEQERAVSILNSSV